MELFGKSKIEKLCEETSSIADLKPEELTKEKIGRVRTIGHYFGRNTYLYRARADNVLEEIALVSYPIIAGGLFAALLGSLGSGSYFGLGLAGIVGGGSLATILYTSRYYRKKAEKNEIAHDKVLGCIWKLYGKLGESNLVDDGIYLSLKEGKDRFNFNLFRAYHKMEEKSNLG